VLIINKGVDTTFEEDLAKDVLEIIKVLSARLYGRDGTLRLQLGALAEWQRQYEARKADPTLPNPSQMALRCQLNNIKGEQFPWMLEVTKNAPQMVITAGRPAAVGAQMDVSRMRIGSQPRCECSDSFEKSGGEFHRVSLWRGRLWLWS